MRIWQWLILVQFLYRGQKPSFLDADVELFVFEMMTDEGLEFLVAGSQGIDVPRCGEREEIVYPALDEVGLWR